MNEIKNIIFDLGGVILNIDFNETILAFNSLSDQPFEAIYNQAQQKPIFDLFDKGQITETDFFNALKPIVKPGTSEAQLHIAWNAILLDLPANRLQLLNTLKQHYRLFLLSNTNETHIRAFEANLQQRHGYNNFEPFFEKVYYSCRLGMRKPDAEIFECVLQENKLNSAETIFIDDSIQHIEGACKTGIKAHLLEKNKEVRELLKELKLI